MEVKNNEFCCKYMKMHVDDFLYKKLDGYDIAKSRIWYDPQHRSYGLMNYTGDWDDVHPSWMEYCPFCGKKLPKELDDDDMDPYLMKEYGWTEDDCWGYPRRELPDEFKTDEWWKKRGL